MGFSTYTALSAVAKQDPELWLVCLLGVGVVFLGLICIIAIVSLMNALTAKASKAPVAGQNTKPAPVAAPTPAAAAPIENRGEIVAAVCAAVAEELGTDVSAIRIVSFKKIN